MAFKSSPSTLQQASMGAVLCSSYYAILITLHRTLLPPRVQMATAGSSLQKAVGAARSCLCLAPSIKDAIPCTHYLSFFIQHLFSSAVIILLCLMHSSSAQDGSTQIVMAEVQNGVATLESLEGRWPGAARCKALLGEFLENRISVLIRFSDELIAVTLETMKNGPVKPEPSPPPAGRHLRKGPKTSKRPTSKLTPDLTNSPDSVRSDSSFPEMPRMLP